MELRAAGFSDTGSRRDNQDRVLVEASSGIFILADGMGGERCGELAAEIAVRTAGDYLAKRMQAADHWPFEYDRTLDLAQNRVMNGVRLANRKVWEVGLARHDCQGMGSTLSVLVCEGNSATIGNIGDSRVCILRDRRLRLLTQDDAVVANMVVEGKITEEEARIHPLRNVLTLALGQSEDTTVQLVSLSLKVGDRLLLTSDGAHGVLRQSELAKIVGEQSDPSEIARNVVNAAKRSGSADNISCIVVVCT